MTNGEVDSILELPEAEQERAREEAWAVQHPDCEVCGETLCLAGRSGCRCGELEGMRVPGTLAVAVHLGACHVTYEAMEGYRG